MSKGSCPSTCTCRTACGQTPSQHMVRSLQEHALASAAITEAGGVDLEQILTGWVQPGR